MSVHVVPFVSRVIALGTLKLLYPRMLQDVNGKFILLVGLIITLGALKLLDARMG